MHPINFGTVIYDDVYKIYRSAELGKLGLDELCSTLEVEDKEFPKTIIYMNKEGYAMPLYFAIEEYKARLDYGFEYFHPFGKVRTYVDGENPYFPTDIIDNWKYFGIIARKYFEKGDGSIQGGVDAVIRVLELVLDPSRQPVLFHCFGGCNRTGMIAMCLRLMQGWEWPDVMKEYKNYAGAFYRATNVEFVAKFETSSEFARLKAKFEAANKVLSVKQTA